jgi:hypothetical protein
MDALQKLFNWAEDNHYLTTTHNIINAASKQVQEMETQLAALKNLVREMGKFIRDMVERELLALELHLPNSVAIKMSQERADKILSNPEVKKLMEEE